MELELNALFLPLLGGFLFYYSFHGTQYIAGRRPGAVLLFWCASIGLMLLLLARLIMMSAQWSSDNESPIGSEILGFTAPPLLLSGLVGLVLLGIQNWLSGSLFALACVANR